MQDKETVDDPGEALTCKAETTSERRGSFDKKSTESISSKKEKDTTKDGKFAFRKMKQPKKEKSEKDSLSRFQGEGVIFKAKLIGVESVSDARGDKMCQDTMQKLKQNVKNIAPHKRKINVCVSLQGIKIKDEKNGNIIYHHPVSLISFISQDITDARAFGYVFGSTDEPHQFIAIKTEKPAFHVVIAIRDLFQTVLNFKQEEIGTIKDEKRASVSEVKVPQEIQKSETDETNKAIQEQRAKEENIYFEVLLTEPFTMNEEPQNIPPLEPQTVDDLLGDITKLKEGINQMDSSIAAVAAFNSEVAMKESDPFDTSFVLGPKRKDSFPLPMPTPIPLASTIPTSETTRSNSNPFVNGDKYAVFNAIDVVPSLFEPPADSAESEENTSNDVIEQTEETRRAAPAKPPRNSKTPQPDLSVFADLDPLGKDRPYKDKTEFFQDVKNPPKKVLNDLVDPNKESFDINMLSPSVPFPVDFDSNQNIPNPLSSSLPNSFYTNSKLSLPVQNGNSNALNNHEQQDKATPAKALTSRSSEPTFKVLGSNGVISHNIVNSSYLGKSPPSNTLLGPTHQLTINSINGNHPPINLSSSPIPIPPRQTNFNKDRSLSNGSIGSPYSKSPVSFAPDSPDSYSPNGLIMKNGHYSNGEHLPTLSPPTNIPHRQNCNNNANSQNGTSRPRPRPTLSKSSSVASNGHSHSSHSLSSDSSSDYEAISRESMQSIANVLLTSGHRLRAQSLCLETNNEYSLQGDKNIFAKKNDPFADDFFYSVPKKVNHRTNTEIPEYV